MLERHGYVFGRTGKGDHVIYRHAETGRIVVVDGKPGQNVAAGTLASIRRATGIGKEELP